MKKPVSVLLFVILVALIVAPLPAAAAPLASPPPGCAEQYVVRAGNTLSSIAVRFGTIVWTLAAINGITNVNRIYIGQVLCVRTVTPPPPPPPPPPGPGWWYTVKWGDTLSSIGARYGWSWHYLAQVNHLSNPNFIWAGQKLLIPYH
jgi:lysozyme